MLSNFAGLICFILSILFFSVGEPQMFAIYNVGSLILLTRGE